MIPIRYHRGLELPAHGLWLDPHVARPCAFISHAHSDHIARHAEVVTSPAPRGSAARGASTFWSLVKRGRFATSPSRSSQTDTSAAPRNPSWEAPPARCSTPALTP